VLWWITWSPKKIRNERAHENNDVNNIDNLRTKYMHKIKESSIECCAYNEADLIIISINSSDLKKTLQEARYFFQTA
jgi:hypothetical protein